MANFILMDYGTGAIFGCPAHDQRDLDFARKYKLKVKPVVIPEDQDPKKFEVERRSLYGPGRSRILAFLDGLTVDEAKDKVATRLEKAKKGERADQLSSAGLGRVAAALLGLSDPDHPLRPECGAVPVPEHDLPVTLPYDVTFDKPGNPLDRHPTWKHVRLPQV